MDYSMVWSLLPLIIYFITLTYTFVGFSFFWYFCLDLDKYIIFNDPNSTKKEKCFVLSCWDEILFLRSAEDGSDSAGSDTTSGSAEIGVGKELWHKRQRSHWTMNAPRIQTQSQCKNAFRLEVTASPEWRNHAHISFCWKNVTFCLVRRHATP